MNLSLRLRLALVSSLLTGLALCAFGTGAWWIIREMRITQLDASLRNSAMREVRRSRAPGDWQRVESRLASDMGLDDTGGMVLLVQTDDGFTTVHRSAHWPAALDPAPWPWPVRPPHRRAPPQGNDHFRPPEPPQTGALLVPLPGGQTWHVALAASADSRVALAADTRGIDAEMAGIRNAFALCLVPVLLLVGLGAWALSVRALRPVDELIRVSRRVTADRLDRRISIADATPEFSELAEVFNRMLARLERSFRQASRFSADAAHELKTPLAILQGQLERTLQSAPPGSDLQAELAGILDEIRRLSTITHKLLLLSKADAGRLKLQLEPFALSRAMEDLLEDAHMLAPHLRVDGHIQPDLVVQADGEMLQQVLHNLLSNAIKYNVPDGWIHITADLLHQGVEIVVANASAGIPEAERDRIFQRFYRADAARSRRVDGVGLGLSVAREIARAHGGDIALRSSGAGRVEFTLTLPGHTLGGGKPAR